MTAPIVRTTEQKHFIEKVGDAAAFAEKLTGIPARFGIAQAAHESRNGLSRLSAEFNNFFGIKATVRPTVPRKTVTFETREQLGNGKWVTIKAEFAAYGSIIDCWTDWANYIQRRYPKAYAAALKNDFPTFAAELRAGGYATDQAYPRLLASQFESLWGYA